MKHKIEIFDQILENYVKCWEEDHLGDTKKVRSLKSVFGLAHEESVFPGYSWATHAIQYLVYPEAFIIFGKAMKVVQDNLYSELPDGTIEFPAYNSDIWLKI